MNEFESSDGAQVYTPRQLNQEVKLHLEAGFPRVLLEAEVSNLSRPASGHLYFSLKDEAAQVRCAMFRSSVQRSAIALENGMKVLARGRISLYEARGDYQFIVDGLRAAGEGELQRQFELLKKKLEAEGLFSPELKKALPAYPLRIGLITSRSGAAVKDMIQVLGRRWPLAELRLYAVSVQGAEAPAELRDALLRANRENWAEVLIMGRGGGSLEDLQAFNDEALARSVAASAIPIISAVGHETDFSICDFAADLRAPTPSAAAELATPDQSQIRHSLHRYQGLLMQRMQTQLQKRMQGLDFLAHRLSQRHPQRTLAEQKRQLVRTEASLQSAVRGHLRALRLSHGALDSRLRVQHPERKLQEYRLRLHTCLRASRRLIAARLERSTAHVHEMGRTLHAVSPLATMGRGYAILREPREGTVISRVEQTGPGSQLSAQLADGRLHCKVESIDRVRLESGKKP